MADQLVQQQPTMEMITADDIAQLSKKFKTELDQALARQGASAILTHITQSYIAASGTQTAIALVNAIQQSNTLIQMTAQSGHLTPDLQEALMQNRGITIQGLNATHLASVKIVLEDFTASLQRIATQPIEKDGFFKRVFGG